MKLLINTLDIISVAGNMTLSNSLDTLGDQLDFEILYENGLNRLSKEINLGDTVQLFDNDNTEVFRGVITNKNRAVNGQSFNAFDYAFYLNKSKAIRQFNKIRIDVAIKQLLKDFAVDYNYIPNISIITNKVFFDKTIADIIKELLEDATAANGKKYIMEMKAGKLNIYEDTEMILDLKVRLASNLPEVNILETISNPSKSASLEDYKNSLVIYYTENDNARSVLEIKDQAKIKKYGLLQETQSIDKKDIAQAKHIAQNTFAEISKIIATGSIEVLGHFGLKAGRILKLNEPQTGLIGKYEIISVNHAIGSTHTSSVELKEVI